MRELNVNEIEQVNGGMPIIVAMAAAYVLRKYGGKMLALGAGLVLGWLSEE